MSIFTKASDALGSFGTGLFGGLLGSGLDFLSNQLAYGQTKDLMDYQYQLQQQAIDKQNLYNSPQEQMKRLAAAQLSPNLVYGSGVDGNQSSAANPGIANRQFKISNPLQDAAAQYVQEKQLEMEKIRMRNEAFESRERQLNLRAKTLGQLIQNDYDNQTLKTRVQRQAQGLINDMARGDLTYQQYNNAVIQAGVLKEQADVLAAKEKLTTEQAMTEIIKRRLYGSEILVNGKKMAYMDSNIRLNNAKIEQISHLITFIDAGTNLRNIEFLIKDLGWESSNELQKYLKDHPNVQLFDALIDKLLGKYGAFMAPTEKAADIFF